MRLGCWTSAERTKLTQTEGAQWSHDCYAFTDVTQGGRASSANAASPCPAVAMASVSNPGSATVRQAGGGVSVTKVQKVQVNMSTSYLS